MAVETNIPILRDATPLFDRMDRKFDHIEKILDGMERNICYLIAHFEQRINESDRPPV